MEYLSFEAVLLFLGAYWVIERCLKTVYQHVWPEFYAKVCRKRKDSQYFAFLMGILIVITTTPLCYHAFDQSTSSIDILGSPHLPSSGQLCLISRGVLWASELNRLDDRYIIHHLSSLGDLSYHIQNGIPLRPIYLFFASLISELFSDTSCLLALHGLKPENSTIAWKVHVVNLGVIVCVKLPPCLFAMGYLGMDEVWEPRVWFHVACLGAYTRWNVNAVFAISRRLKVLRALKTNFGSTGSKKA